MGPDLNNNANVVSRGRRGSAVYNSAECFLPSHPPVVHPPGFLTPRRSIRHALTLLSIHVPNNVAFLESFSRSNTESNDRSGKVDEKFNVARRQTQTAGKYFVYTKGV